MTKNKQVTCRPCKEEEAWEIKTPNGKVMPNHFNTKADCVRVGRKYAQECGGDLVVENKNDTASKSRKSTTFASRRKTSK